MRSRYLLCCINLSDLLFDPSSKMSKKLLRPCPICGYSSGCILHTQHFEVPEDYPLPKSYDIVNCSGCGFVFADTPARQREYDEFYSRFSKYEDNRTTGGGGLDELDRKRLLVTADTIGTCIFEKEARILDIGAANGGLLESLRGIGFDNLVGLDPSAECVGNIKSSVRVNAYRGSLSQLPDIGDFDLVVLSHVLEHICDLRQAVRQIVSLLKPNGKTYIEVPDADRYSQYVNAPFQEFNTEHINHFSEQSLTTLFEQFGFKKLSEGFKTIESPKDIYVPAVYLVFEKNVTTGISAPKFDKRPVVSIRNYIKVSRDYLAELESVIEDVLSRHPEVIVWGAGQLFYKLFREPGLSSARVAAIIDSNPINQGKVLKGIGVVSPEEAKKYTCPIIITTTLHDKAIRRDIENLRLENEVIRLPKPLGVKFEDT